MNKTTYFFLLVLLLSKITHAQHENITKNWKTISINDSILGEVNYHVYKNNINKKKPLIIYLQGSTNYPLYYVKPNGRYSSGITLNAGSMSNDYHVVLISKPNTPFVDSLEIAPSGRIQYPWREGYSEKYSLDWRANSADKVINDALKKLKVDTSTIIVWGHSEGSQVAPAVALKNKNVTHVISMMGNSLNHLYDFILNERVSALKDEKSNEEAQRNIDSLYVEFEKIYKDPKSKTKEWFGESYYKWSSFTLNSPIDNMLKLDIPILYVAGGEDHHSILNMDYAKLEFLRKGKNNLTYKVYPNCDHFFIETKTDESGKKEWIDHLNEVNGFALKWVTENK
ncbi:dienelactone hydrolase family protein [Winogradskyella luteola]|uniref:Dienelactone hydrolase family protein n=1 Tax=Winogradskyella luteola TaxID=2828330 RepID=A0A9X1F540_9FLAO|nr:dienelactone hydrolase family protein [Winogradskyella luteola]MBV7267570.1 dienelactone hydrolase family protein [Winogradskyella luteola]